MTLASATGGILFNLTTNGNAQLLTERFRGVMNDPATLGLLLASIYAIAPWPRLSSAGSSTGSPLKPLYLSIALLQVPVLLCSSQEQGWALYAGMLGMMIFIFGAIPFTDAMIVRYVDDQHALARRAACGWRCRSASARSPSGCWGRSSKAWASTSCSSCLAGVGAVHRVHGAMASVGTARSRDGGGVAGPLRREAVCPPLKRALSDDHQTPSATTACIARFPRGLACRLGRWCPETDRHSFGGLQGHARRTRLGTRRLGADGTAWVGRRAERRCRASLCRHEVGSSPSACRGARAETRGCHPLRR